MTNIEKINGFWVPSYDAQIEDWRVAGAPHMQDKCLKSFLKWCDSQQKQFKTMIDIGAWCGTWSYAMQSYAKKIIAFEPSLIHFNCLEKNLGPYNNITCNNCAIGNQNGTISLTNDSATQNTRIEKESGKTAIYKLDNFNYKDVDLIKIDVEGYEMKVLEGAAKTLETVKFLMIELNHNTEKYGSSNVEVKKYVQEKLGFQILINVWPDIIFFKV